MRNVLFGLGYPCGNGSTPSVGLNCDGRVVMVHENQTGEKFYRVGILSQATIKWGQIRTNGSGKTPRVALNGENIAVEVHWNEQNKLYCSAGRLGGDDIVTWSRPHGYGDGGNPRFKPAVALNDAGLVVELHEMHEGKKWVCYSVGQVKENSGEPRVEWSAAYKHVIGIMPTVAINSRGTVVEVHRYVGDKDSGLLYSIGRVKGTKIEFGETNKRIVWAGGRRASGQHPSVAVTDDGLVIVVVRAQNEPTVCQITGQASPDGKTITWNGTAWYYDDGDVPSVAAAGTMAVAVHQRLPELLFSTSIITDRARWMENRLDTLGRKRLGDLVLPASHDAGMYPKGVIADLGRTQNMSIYEQLLYGIRYFDLRPAWTNKRWLVRVPKEAWSLLATYALFPPPLNLVGPVSLAAFHAANVVLRSRFVLAHDIVVGPSLVTVLSQIREFAEKENRRELVILKFSHFDGIDEGIYKKLVEQIRASLGPWLVTRTPGDKRLADVTLREYRECVKKGPAILVVVDGEWAVKPKVPGFWVYRDRDSNSPAEGDLRVFDKYSNTTDFETMRTNQLDKFAKYGAPGSRPCDLFLLSWTLTPPPFPSIPDVWKLSNPASRFLGQDIRVGHPPAEIPNEHGKIMNLLYVDFVEFARVTDVALFHNGEPVSRATEATPKLRARAAAPKRAKRRGDAGV